MHYCEVVETDMGKLWIACSPDGITMITLARETWTPVERTYRKLFGVVPQPGKVPERYKRALRRAVAGHEYAPVPIDLSGVTKFQLRVLKELQKVPRGEVRTYSWLAQKAGCSRAARAVGSAMARNPVPFLVPCHRVVPASGGTGNYGLGKSRKRELLRREGVAVDQL